MEVSYDKQRKQFIALIGEKIIRLKYFPTHPDTITDCGEFCLLGKSGINCMKLRHPENPRKTLTDFCACLGFEYEHLLESKELPSDFVPDYKDILDFYTQEEIEKAKD